MKQSLSSIIATLPKRLNIVSAYDYHERIKHLYAINAVNTHKQAFNMFKALPAKDKVYFFNHCDCSEQLQTLLV